MFQEEGIDSCYDSTWSSLVLEYTILQLLIEIETLTPRIVEIPIVISK